MKTSKDVPVGKTLICPRTLVIDDRMATHIYRPPQVKDEEEIDVGSKRRSAEWFEKNCRVVHSYQDYE